MPCQGFIQDCRQSCDDTSLRQEAQSPCRSGRTVAGARALRTRDNGQRGLQRIQAFLDDLRIGALGDQPDGDVTDSGAMPS